MYFQIKKINFPVCILLLLSFIVGLVTINYGLPYSLHPDESYIIKDPLKNILNYSHFEFTNTMSLFNWCLLIWYGLVFLFGLLFHQWLNFTEFKNLIIIESGTIYFYGRLLSVIMITVAHYVIYRLLSKLSNRKHLTAITLIPFIFNPVLLASVYWVKFDVATYLASCILLNLLLEYFVLGNSDIRGKIYYLSIAFISIRIEIICFLVSLLVFDYLRSKSASKPFYDKFFVRSVLAGILLYACITFYPITVLYKTFHSCDGDAVLATEKTFETAIGSGVIAQINSGKFLSIFTDNLKFYLTLSSLSMLPAFLITLLLLHKFIRNKIGYALESGRTLFLYFYMFLFLVVLLLFPYHATHYFLSIVTIMLLITSVCVLTMTNVGARNLFLGINLAYIVTLSAEFLMAANLKPDTRFLATAYILSKTNIHDLIAVETMSMDGYHPLLNESAKVLRDKSEAVKKIMKGTGLQYELRAKMNIQDSRNILDIFSVNYLNNNDWINDYDLNNFKSKHPEYYATTYDMKTRDANMRVAKFYDYIAANYIQDTTFQLTHFDYRLKFLLSTEPYFKNVYFYHVRL